MRTTILLDSGPLSQITHPRVNPHIRQWLTFIKTQRWIVQIPEICDYEVRRELLLHDFDKSIGRLNQFRQRKQLLAITSETLLTAAEIWAWIRAKGQSTKDDRALDVDVILIAQAIAQQELFERVIVVTTDRDIVRFEEFGLRTWFWKQALSDGQYGEVNLHQTQLNSLLRFGFKTCSAVRSNWIWRRFGSWQVGD